MQRGNRDCFPSNGPGGTFRPNYCDPCCPEAVAASELGGVGGGSHGRRPDFSALTWTLYGISPERLDIYPRPQEGHRMAGQQTEVQSGCAHPPANSPGAGPRAWPCLMGSAPHIQPRAPRAAGWVVLVERLQSRDKAGGSQLENKSPEEGEVHGQLGTENAESHPHSRESAFSGGLSANAPCDRAASSSLSVPFPGLTFLQGFHRHLKNVHESFVSTYFQVHQLVLCPVPAAVNPHPRRVLTSRRCVV